MDAEQDGLPVPRRYWAVLAIALAITLAVLDSAIANVALPTIARELNASPAASVWVVNAYQLAIVISLLPLAALGEIVGYRRVYMAGLILFVLASLGCAMARSIDMLALARIVQGFGGAGIMAINGALVRHTYPQAKLGQGLGINAMVVSVSAALGPTVASGILSVAPWPWLFGVNVPIGIAAIAVASFALPHTQTSGRRFDWPSALLNAAAFGLIVYGVEVWGRGQSLARRRRRRRRGSSPPSCWRCANSQGPRRSCRSTCCASPSSGSRWRRRSARSAPRCSRSCRCPSTSRLRLGRSAVETGLLMTPWPVAVGLAAPVAGHLADRYPAGLLGGVGLAVLALGLALLVLMPAHPGDIDIVWRMAVCGLGFGLFQSPNNRAMMFSAPRQRSGAAGGMLATARLVGQTAGAACVAIIFRIEARETSHTPLIVAAVLSAIAAGVSLVRLIDPRGTPTHAAPSPPRA